MHGLDVIIRKNAEAVGRAVAEAENAGDLDRAQDIAWAYITDSPKQIPAAVRLAADLAGDDAYARERGIPAYIRARGRAQHELPEDN